jgi:multidrug efflux pump subunit AcrB
LTDQSVLVTDSINGVVREAAIAALLTALMILIFLGDWRSTVIIAISIPLSIFASIAVFSAVGQTINTMSLGGLALAVGLLVDDATVTIENVHRHMGEKKPTLDAIWCRSDRIAGNGFNALYLYRVCADLWFVRYTQVSVHPAG